MGSIIILDIDTSGSEWIEKQGSTQRDLQRLTR